jgi:ABC-2 type transport system permease protein
VNPFQRSSGPPPKEKGNSEAFYRSLGVAWINTEIAWDLYNPHPDLARIQPEIVFVGEGTDTVESFGRASTASAGLQELVLLYPGVLEAAGAQEGTVSASTTGAAPDAAPSGFEVTPLLRTSARSGSLPYQALVQRNFLFGAQLVTRGIPHEPDHRPRTLAVATRGQGVNAIVVADVDFISDQFFELRRRGLQNLNFDNVSFLLNCMDVLVGDDSFVELRKKRVRHRTLERVEERTREFVDRRMNDQKEAQAEAEKALQEAQQRLDAKVAELRSRTDLDEQARAIMTRNLQEVENRRFETLKTNIEAARETRIQKSKETMESEVRRIESNIKTLAVLLPPIPVFAMGVVIFARRRRRELEGAVLSRRWRSESGGGPVR